MSPRRGGGDPWGTPSIRPVLQQRAATRPVHTRPPGGLPRGPGRSCLVQGTSHGHAAQHGSHRPRVAANTQNTASRAENVAFQFHLVLLHLSGQTASGPDGQPGGEPGPRCRAQMKRGDLREQVLPRPLGSHFSAPLTFSSFRFGPGSRWPSKGAGRGACGRDSVSVPGQCPAAGPSPLGASVWSHRCRGVCVHAHLKVGADQ